MFLYKLSLIKRVNRKESLFIIIFKKNLVHIFKVKFFFKLIFAKFFIVFIYDQKSRN